MEQTNIHGMDEIVWESRGLVTMAVLSECSLTLYQFPGETMYTSVLYGGVSVSHKKPGSSFCGL